MEIKSIVVFFSVHYRTENRMETGWKPGKWPYVAFGENAFSRRMDRMEEAGMKEVVWD